MNGDKKDDAGPTYHTEKIKKIVLMDIITGHEINHVIVEDDVIRLKFTPDGKNLVAAVDAFTGMMTVALLTGLFFARFSFYDLYQTRKM